jgi:hypothetical protein
MVPDAVVIFVGNGAADPVPRLADYMRMQTVEVSGPTAGTPRLCRPLELRNRWPMLP